MLSSVRIGLHRCSPTKFVGALLLLGALGFGGCAQQPQQLAAASHGKEYFPSSKYGAASRRVVEDGQPIPRGGGQYLVGKPYTVAGQTYYPSEHKIVQIGNASWYGDAFHGRLTANGEIYDKNSFTAAHPTMPLPSYARVTNLRNNSSMIVRVNDRGPYASSRIMDVSGRVAEALDFKRYGTAKLKVEYVGRASLAGSDDARLFATLRTDGPAQWRGEPTMVAAAPASARVASIAPYAPAEARAETDSPMEPSPEALRRARRDIDRDMAKSDIAKEEIAKEQIASEERQRPAPSRHQARDVRPTRLADREEARHEDIHRAEAERYERQMQPGRQARTAPEPPARTAERHAAERHTADTRMKPGPVTYSIAKATIDAGVVARSMSGKSGHAAMLPPSRPMDLGTIPGADSPIRAHHPAAQINRAMALRMARARDD